MATHYLPELTTGLINGEGLVELWITAATNLLIWGPVALAAAGSGEYVARVDTTSSANDETVIGVCVGPLRDAENLYASDAAGQTVQICTFGKTKCKVDGAADNIAVGDALVSHAAVGVAQLMDADDGASWADVTAQIGKVQAGFAKALYASTVDLDIIAVHVHGARGTKT